MTILKILFSSSWGGLEIIFSVYAKMFKEKGHKIICIIEPNPQLENELKKNSIEFITVKPFTRYLDLYTALKIKNLVKKNRIDIIHAYKSRELSTIVLVKKLLGSPKLVFSQHMDSRYDKNDFFHKWIYKNIDKIICVTKSMMENNLEHAPVNSDKIIVIQNGIDLNKFRPDINFNKSNFRKEKNIPANKIIIGTIGRLDRLKNQLLLIEIAKVLVKRSNIHFVIVGDETKSITGFNYKEELMQNINENNLKDNFSFFNFSDEIEKYFAIFDIFILPTPKESFGLVLIEAMAMGKPVIASNRGGPPEIIKDGINGYLFDHDKIEFLIEQLQNLIEKKELRDKMGNKSIEIVKLEFDLNKKVDEYLTTFKNLK